MAVRPNYDPELAPLVKAIRARLSDLKAEITQKDGLEVQERDGIPFLQLDIRQDHMILDLWLPEEGLERARASGIARPHPFMGDEAVKVRFERARDLTRVARWLEESYRFAPIREKLRIQAAERKKKAEARRIEKAKLEAAAKREERKKAKAEAEKKAKAAARRKARAAARKSSVKKKVTKKKKAAAAKKKTSKKKTSKKKASKAKATKKKTTKKKASKKKAVKKKAIKKKSSKKKTSPKKKKRGKR